MSVEWIDAARCRRAGVDPEWFNSPSRTSFPARFCGKLSVLCAMKQQH